jgi:MFS family permease
MEPRHFPNKTDIEHGIFVNRHQFGLHVLQIFMVGLTIGMIRVVVPGLAETEFGLADQAFFLLTSFVVVFGLIKAVMNLFAGRLSEQYGRKSVLVWGWLVALPVPFLLLYADSWGWVIAATILLGFNQGLTWSMALNSKLDLAKPSQKGLVNGVNEFSGYAAVGLAGLVTAYFVDWFGAREGLFIFSLAVILLGLALAEWTLAETLPWAERHQALAETGKVAPDTRSFKQLFHLTSREDASLVAINQAGLVEKFTDALVWIFLPVYFLAQGLTLVEAGAIIAVYGLVWGGAQLVTGPLSDKIGRKGLIVWGMWLCGAGVLAIPLSQGVVWWTLEAGLVGLGMAMLYPNLGAAAGDFAPVAHRASVIGIYRFWRDSGYAFGALAMGLAAQISQNLQTPFWLVAMAMGLSGIWVAIKVRYSENNEAPVTSGEKRG